MDVVSPSFSFDLLAWPSELDQDDNVPSVLSLSLSILFLLPALND